MPGSVAVLDIGKTNLKVLIFDASGRMVAERSQPNAPLPPDAACPYLHLDTEGAWAFLIGALKDLSGAHDIEAISLTTHGAAGVLAGADDFALPPMDYETDALEAEAAVYDGLRPPFAETQSPRVPRGLNLGRQFFHLMRHFPDGARRTKAMLAYPQYWAWRLSGVLASEVTSLGSHTDLWNPGEAKLSSLVERLGWGFLFPPLRNAWDTLGTVRPEVAAATGLKRDTRVLCGAHDSNASLVPHLAGRKDPFSVISTGTWVILMAVGGRGALDPQADMLANVDVLGRPTPCARFMGGREFSTLAGASPPPIAARHVCEIVAAGTLALPAFSDQGGPFADRAGRIEGPPPATAEGRAALATLYVALMTEYLLERLEAPGEWIVEGGFARSPAFAATLAAIAPERQVTLAGSASGAAEGAAMLARWGETREAARTLPAEAWEIPGLAGYRARWRAAL
jgi:sugar (pentulose or hexulose) kinase